MIRYLCKKCNLECETSICPVCNSRADLEQTAVFFCANCNAPSFEKKCNCCGSNCDYIGTDLRPVFPEERLLIEVLLHEPFKFAEKSVWNVGGSKYIVDGKKLNLSYKELRTNNDCKYVIEELKKYTYDNQKYVDSYMKSDSVINFIKINRPRHNSITYEAIEYIRYIAKDKDESEMFVSFSGGKDSTVTSDLVMNALSNKRIIHIYGDTTLEYPTSEVYIKRFRTNHPNIPLLTAKNRDQDFNNLCELIGPPARMMRWCCTVFKTGAITKKIDSTFKNVKQVITFQGIRRNESASRNKYDRESNDSKIKKQIAVEPIIDWMDFDVWLYILSNNIDFNDAYKQGFSRVGCWCCPNNSSWSEYLSSIYMNDEFNKFRDILYKFAEKIGKPDWKTYVDDGEWKKRQGGNGLEISKNTVVSFKPCALEENTYNFNLTKNIGHELYKFFIPFGKLNFEIGKKALNEVYVLDKKSNMPILKLSGREGTDLLKVTIVDDSKAFKIKKNAEMLLKNQINKYQTCIGCTYCEAVCTHDAIKVFNTEKGNVSNDTIHYSIDPNKCVGCLECVKHFQNGCYINKVLRTKKED